MIKRLLLIGGGGHCKSVLDSLLAREYYTEIGIIDHKENRGKAVLGIPIIGSDSDLEDLYSRGYTYAFVTLGSIGNSAPRVKLFAELKRIGFEIPYIVDSTAIISRNVFLEKGVYVGKNAVINADAAIGKGAIINTAAIIEHDCQIGAFVHIAPGSVLCGQVQIGAYTHIGAKSVVKQQVKIGANTMIGMGSLVLRNVPEDIVAFGNPCKEVSKNECPDHCGGGDQS
jgi:sugar O-acyltransferase (sialic acid O-acetyltransferase NeuD family)